MPSRALDLERRVLRLLDARGVVGELVRRDAHSNEVVEVHLEDGRTLLIKRAPDPSLSRFAVSKRAASLARQHTTLQVPEHLDLPELPDDVLAYWWLPWPTLDTRWRDRDDRRDFARSWGRCLAELHAIRLPGHGALDGSPAPLRDWLARDLGDRLAPAIAGPWPRGRALLDALLPLVEALPEAPATLVHNDLFDRNLLCDPVADEVIGMLDFEDAFAGPAEADLAKTELLHGPLFRDPIEGDWFDALLDAWGRLPDPKLLSTFRLFNLLNMGFYGALQGYEAHVDELARAIEAELDAFGDGRRHRSVLGQPAP